MTLHTLILRSLRFHWRAHLGVVLGAAVGSAALIGALVVGDSVRESLRARALERLGQVRFALQPGDRFVTEALADNMPGWLRDNWRDGDTVLYYASKPAAALTLPALAAKSDGSARANRVNLIGVSYDARAAEANSYMTFWYLAYPAEPSAIAPGEVWLNEALAAQLNAQVGDTVIFRVHKPSVLSRDTPISPRSDASVALRLRVAGIRPGAELGNFSLRASQAPPFNAFVNLAELQRATDLAGRVNLLLAPRIVAEDDGLALRVYDWLDKVGLQRLANKLSLGRAGQVSTEEALAMFADDLQQQIRLADYEAQLRPAPANTVELISRRIFLDPPLVQAARRVGALESWQREEPPPLPPAVLAHVVTNSQPILTYLVNLLRAGTNTSPYSMVTAAGPPWTPADLREDEIVINQWLADDLRVGPGDALELSYYLPESAGRLVEATNRFRIRAVVPIAGVHADRTLMPEFPGLAKAESTHEWDAGFTLEHKIRDHDEQYWKEHRGTPKAFLSLAAGQKLWANRFGHATALRFAVPPGQTAATLAGVLETNLLRSLKPADVGLRFEPVGEQALNAANQAQDFGGLFLGFSFFLIAAALLLMALLFQFGLEQRVAEVGTLLALGFTPKLVRRLFLREGVALAALGGLIGCAGGTAYAWAMLRGLATVWRDAVAGAALDFHVSGKTLVLGAVAAVVVSAATLWLTLRKLARQSARELLSEGAEWDAGAKFKAQSSKLKSVLLRSPQDTKQRVVASPSPRNGETAGVRGEKVENLPISAANVADDRPHLTLPSPLPPGAEMENRRTPVAYPRACSVAGVWLGATATVAALGLVVWALATGETASAGAFFGAGTLLLMGALGFTSAALARLGRSGSPTALTFASLGLRGVTRRRRRSLAVVALLAGGSFLIVAIGVFRLDANTEAGKRASGTGGFALLGETTLPVLRDLNTSTGREFYGLDETTFEEVRFVPFRVRDGDDASCLNLNRAQTPRLLGVNPAMLAERGAFTFARELAGAAGQRGWGLLKMAASSVGPLANRNSPIVDLPEVPAIGDAASIQWALGKKVGDTLDYVDERGRPFQVRIVGAVANSILQGNLIIDEAEFVRRFPGEAGHRMFLIDAPSNRVTPVAAALSRALEDLGLEVTPAARRLAQFNAVQNTYLNTFQVLGGLGLLLGSAGLGVVVLRNVLERRAELGLLLAVGFRRRALQRLVLSEHGALLGLGLATGLVAAVVAVLPAVLAPGAELPWRSLAFTLAGVLASGILWTWLAARVALRGQLLAALRNE
jgi:ABC-type lipoprotein release transport system permease subunit